MLPSDLLTNIFYVNRWLMAICVKCLKREAERDNPKYMCSGCYDDWHYDQEINEVVYPADEDDDDGGEH